MLIVVEKKFKTVAKSVGRQTLRKQLCSGTMKKSASNVIPTKSGKRKSVGREEKVLKAFLINHVE